MSDVVGAIVLLAIVCGGIAFGGLPWVLGVCFGVLICRLVGLC